MVDHSPAQATSDNSEVIVTALFHQHSAEDLFSYFSDPELLVQWWPPAALTEPVLGGSYHLSWPDMDWHLRGEHIEFEPGRRLAFTWRWDHKPELPERLVEMEFEAVAEGSRLTLTQGHYTESQLDQEDRQSHIDGWIHFLLQLQNL